MPRGLPHGYYNKQDKPARALQPRSEFSLVSKLSNKLLFCTQCDSGAFVMLFVCVDPDFSIASMADAASISYRTYFDEHDVRQAGQATI